MDETKATPRPWSWDGNHITDPSNTVVAVDGIAQPHGYVPQDDVSRANSQLIITAVNAFEDMRDALKEARRYVEGAYECAFPDEIGNGSVLARVNAALRKAGAE